MKDAEKLKRDASVFKALRLQFWLLLALAAFTAWDVDYHSKLNHRGCSANLQITTLLVLPIPAFKRVLCRVAQLANGRSNAPAELDVEFDGSNSIFV